jgi:uncharacterized membrane protein YjfL (UPF0719 family)
VSKIEKAQVCDSTESAIALPFLAICGILVCRSINDRLQEGNVEQLFLSLIQLIIAVVLGAIAAYLAFYLFQWFTRGVNEWEALRQGNAAVGVVLGAMLIAVAIVLRPALLVNTAAWDVGGGFFFRVLLAEAVQLAVGLVLAVVTLAVALYLFAALTRGIDEVEELKKGNLAVAGLLAGVVIGIGLMVSQAVGEIMRLVASVLF